MDRRSDGAGDGGAGAAAVAFAAVPRAALAADNAVGNPRFAQGGADGAAGWQRFGGGYGVDPSGGPAGGAALRLDSAGAGAARGAVTTVALDQRRARAIYISARSRADAVTGAPDDDYSLYVDLEHADGTASFGHTLPFDTGTHGWQLRERVLVPERPVARARVHCLLRNGHRGTAWFDDVVVREAPAGTLALDGRLVRAPAPGTARAAAAGTGRAPAASLHTGDGLALDLDAAGAVTAVRVDGRALSAAAGDPGGFFVRDARAGGDFLRPHAPPRRAGEGALEQAAAIAPLGLELRARLVARPDRLDVHAQLEDRRGQDRAITLYFALPLAFTGPDAPAWRWGRHARDDVAAAGDDELAVLAREWDIGATGAVSRYPFAGVWSTGAGAGVAFAHGLAEPRAARLVVNPASGHLYAAFDVALTRDTARFPGRAWVNFTLYRFAPAWGFRAMAQGYYDRHPQAFARRMPPAREGTWLPFTATGKIRRPADFGFGVHELHDLGEVARDEALGIGSYRYLQVPDSYALWLDGPRAVERDAALEARVEARLAEQHARGTPAERRQAEAILSSALHDAAGRPVWRWSPAGQIPWCGGKAGCAFFAVSADPALHDARYPLNKAHADWSDEARASYQRHPGLDGEFIDGVQASTFRLLLDQRRGHFATATQPLTFAAEGRHIGVPSLFATAAFLDWLAADVHGRGKLLVGNTTCEGLPWGAPAFDHLGVESNWLSDGRFHPDDDATMLYRRTLAGQRPFGLLLNTDFAALARDGGVERAFQRAMFYGVYLSCFSADAANDPYWEDPRLVERDRPLFRRYVPVVRRLSAAGWQVVTLARSSHADVALERFGDRFGGPAAPLLTIANLGDVPATATITLDPALGLPGGAHEARSLIAPARRWRIVEGRFTVTLAAGGVEAVTISPAPDPT